MKAKTVWKNWWRSGPEISCNSRWGYDGKTSKPKSVVFGLDADVRWVNVIGLGLSAVDLSEDEKS